MSRYSNSLTSGAKIKYHGLFNQGATCYLNSVLQVLFMTKDFREAVERHTRENPDTEFFDLHLKTLFDNLKKKTARTCKITEKLGITKVYEEHDAAEYLEKILALTSPEASRIFRGQLRNETKCSPCGTVTGTGGPIWHLPLALVDLHRQNYSVVNGIKEFFKVSYISGEDQLYCENCDAKTDAVVKCVITDHPDVLMLLLKRFEFDYRCMRYVKRNNMVDIPMILQLQENQTYELYAFVDHFGSLKGGHYTATIKSQENNDEKWYCFDDSSVTLCHYQPLQLDLTERSDRAYLLFYRKKKSDVADTCTPNIRDLSISGDLPTATSDKYDPCQDVENKREGEETGGVGDDTAVAIQAEHPGADSIKKMKYGKSQRKKHREVHSFVQAKLTERPGDVSIKNMKHGNSQPQHDSRFSTDHFYNVEGQDNGANFRQRRSYNNQEYNEGRKDKWDSHQGIHLKKQEQDEGRNIKDNKRRGEKTEAGDQAEKRGQVSTETRPKEGVKDQDYGSARRDVRYKISDLHYGFEPEVSDRQEGHGDNQHQIGEVHSFVQAKLTERPGDVSIKNMKHGNSQPQHDSRFSTDHFYNVEGQDNGANFRQRRSYNNQEYNEGRKDKWDSHQGIHLKKQEQDEGRNIKDNKRRGEKTEAGDQAEKRGQVSTETRPKEGVKDQDYGSARRDVRYKISDIHYGFEPEVSDRQEGHGDNQHQIGEVHSFVQAKLTELPGDVSIKNMKHGNSQPQHDSRFSTDHFYNVEGQDNGANFRQRRSYNNQEYNEGRKDKWDSHQGIHLKKQEQDEGRKIKDNKRRGEKTEAGDQAEKRGQVSTETRPKEGVKDQDYGSAGRDVRYRNPDLHYGFKPEVSDRQETHRYNEHKTRLDHGFRQAGPTELPGDVSIKNMKHGNSQPQHDSRFSTDHFYNVEGQDNGANFRERRSYNNQEYNEGRKDKWDSHQGIHLKKQEQDEGRNIKDNKRREEKTEAGDQAEKRGQVSTETQPKEGVKDQDYGSAGRDVRYRNPDLHYGFKPEVSDRQEKHRYNEHKTRLDNAFRKAGLTELPGDVSIKNMTHENSQPQHYSRFSTEPFYNVEGNPQPTQGTGCKEGTLKGRGGSKHSRLVVKITEEDQRKASGSIHGNSVTKTLTIETGGGTSQDCIKTQVNNEGSTGREHNPQTDIQISVSRGIHNLQLNESNIHCNKRCNRGSGRVTNTEAYSDAKKLRTDLHALHKSKKKD